MSREIIVKEWHDDKGLIHRREVGQELVRCKECVAYIDGTCDCDSIYAHMSGDLIGVDFEPYEDFYCGYGERKSNDDPKEYMMSDFSKYCPSCIHKHLDKWAEPCATCLSMKGQINTDVPIHYEENSQTDYDKGLQLFADILFDKEKNEQFLKECKAMGIEPQTEREGE